jgi:lipopolysaccharide export system protein LptC
MKKVRTAHRLRLILMLMLVGALALGSFWVLEVMRKSTEDRMPDIQRSEPDYYVENFSLLKMTPGGSARYRISGQRLTHYPLDDSYAIQQPRVYNLGQARLPMTMRAERARVEDDSSKIHLYDKVEIDRPASGDTAQFHLASEYLLFLPDDDVMQSDKTVNMTLGKSTLTGAGMVANNATRELRLSGNVRGLLQPPPPK